MNINTDYYNSYFYTNQTAKNKMKPAASFFSDEGTTALSTEEIENLTAEFKEKLTELSSFYNSMTSSGGSSFRIKMMEMENGSVMNGEGEESVWGTDELTQFAETLNKITGESLDVESILSQYDLDEDGSLNKSERAQLMKEIAPPPPGMNKMEFSFTMATEEDSENRTATVSGVKGTEEKLTKIAFANRVAKYFEAYEKSFQFLEGDL